MTKKNIVGLGPCPVPVVPISKFSKLQMPQAALKDVWTLIGPSVEMNIRRLPLWEVVAAAYLEGMNHGAGITQETVDLERKMAAENSKWFVPRSSLGRGFDYLYSVEEHAIDGTWRKVADSDTNDRQAAIARAVLASQNGAEVRIVDNSK